MVIAGSCEMVMMQRCFLFLICSLLVCHGKFQSKRAIDYDEKPIPDESKACKVCSCKEGDPFLLDCSRKQLVSYPPEAQWFSVPEKVTLNLNDNELTFIPPIEGPRSTFQLTFRHNYITNIANRAFLNLTKITFLDLAYNSLESDSLRKDVFQGPFHPDGYQQLPLTKLDLSYNKIHSIPKNAFDHIEKLHELILDGNPIKVISHQSAVALTTLMDLKHLSLVETGLSDFPATFFASFKRLHKLNLASNEFSSVPESMFFNTHLSILVFNKNPIRKLDKTSFQGMNNLKELYISMMPELQIIGAESIGQLDQLEILHCSHNVKLTTLDPQAFRNPFTDFPLLKEVHFRKDALTTLHPDLLPWNDLKICDFQENPFICDCRLIWIFEKGLFRNWTTRNPYDSLLLRCASPPSLADVSFDKLTIDKLSFCPDEDTLKKYPLSPVDSDASSISTQGNIIAILFIAMLSIIFTVCGIIWIKKRRIRESYAARQQVRYKKAHTEEFVDM